MFIGGLVARRKALTKSTKYPMRPVGWISKRSPPLSKTYKGLAIHCVSFRGYDLLAIRRKIWGLFATSLTKVDDLLESIGSERAKILSATIYLKTMADFKVMNQVWEDWVATHPPARACIEAGMADKALLVEISVIAAI